MRLSNFILDNLEVILQEWENYARSIHPNARADTIELRDHAEDMLKVIAADLASDQTEQESIDKSHGHVLRAEGNSMAEVHAATRLVAGFTIDQLVAEYRALRASVVRLWQNRGQSTTVFEMADMTRFNEAIDQALAESVVHYSEVVQSSQNLFLAILGHDVRTPLGAINIGAHVLMLDETLSSKQGKVASRILSSSERLQRIISDLLDFTVANSGEGIPVKPSSVDLTTVCSVVIEEMRTVHADRFLLFNLSGDLQGSVDEPRIGQALSNLVGNALQHGSPDAPVSVTVKGEPYEITLAVHNKGKAIAPAIVPTLFNAIRHRALRPTPDQKGHVRNLGLGLYITNEIVKAHGGDIHVVSTEADGTTFTIRLPRSLK